VHRPVSSHQWKERETHDTERHCDSRSRHRNRPARGFGVFRPGGGTSFPASRHGGFRCDRAARFLVEVTRKRPGAWWRDDFTTRFAIINGLPGVIVDAPEGSVQTTAFEFQGDVIRALYVVRNPDKLRHLGAASRETGPV
jgi:hypothetical protein